MRRLSRREPISVAKSRYSWTKTPAFDICPLCQRYSNLRDTQLSFSQFSRHVGASWQLFGNRELSEWLEKYRQTAEYKEYQRYLVDFKLKDSSSQSRLNRRSTLRRSSNTTDGDLEGSASLGGWLPPMDPSAFLHTQT